VAERVPEHDVLVDDALVVGDELRQARAARVQVGVLARGVTLVGPHRDDWRLLLNNLDARSHASQGEQRTLALALRLAGHRLIATIVGSDPVLLLDDVFSELDPERSAALVEHLPAAQTLVTTAGVLPPGIEAERHLVVHAGAIVDP